MMVDLACAKGVFDGSGDENGKEDRMGEWRVVGSHSLQFRMTLDRSVTDFEMHPHSLGHGFLSKVRWNAMRRKEEPLMEAWERDFEAVLARIRRRGCLWWQLMM